MTVNKEIVNEVMEKYGLVDNGKNYSTININGRKVKEQDVPFNIEDDNLDELNITFSINRTISCADKNYNTNEEINSIVFLDESLAA